MVEQNMGHLLVATPEWNTAPCSAILNPWTRCQKNGEDGSGGFRVVNMSPTSGQANQTIQLTLQNEITPFLTVILFPRPGNQGGYTMPNYLSEYDYTYSPGLLVFDIPQSAGSPFPDAGFSTFYTVRIVYDHDDNGFIYAESPVLEVLPGAL